MTIFGVAKTQKLEAKPLSDIQNAFIKSLVSKKHPHDDGNKQIQF